MLVPLAVPVLPDMGNLGHVIKVSLAAAATAQTTSQPLKHPLKTLKDMFCGSTRRLIMQLGSKPYRF